MLDKFRAYDVHSCDTPIVSIEIWSDSSYRRVSLLHVHGSLGHRQHDTGMVCNKTFGLRYTSNESMTSIPTIPQLSLLKFRAIQVIEGCLCSMSIEVWVIDVCLI